MASAASALKVSTPSDTEIVMTRTFNAPRQLVFDAHTKCNLLKKWMFGPDGWSLDLCEMDLRVGGKYRWVWKRTALGGPQSEACAGMPIEMGAGGEIREFNPPERLVMTERFDQAWYEGEALNTMVLIEVDGKTTMTMTMRYASQKARDTALKSGMEMGMEMGFARLDRIFAEMAAKA